MSNATHHVQSAIDESIRENCIVHLSAVENTQEWVDLAAALGAAATNWVDTHEGAREYWGGDDDGDEWRVHLDGRLR